MHKCIRWYICIPVLTKRTLEDWQEILTVAFEGRVGVNSYRSLVFLWHCWFIGSLVGGMRWLACLAVGLVLSFLRSFLDRRGLKLCLLVCRKWLSKMTEPVSTNQWNWNRVAAQPLFFFHGSTSNWTPGRLSSETQRLSRCHEAPASPAVKWVVCPQVNMRFLLDPAVHESNYPWYLVSRFQVGLYNWHLLMFLRLAFPVVLGFQAPG